MRLFVAVNFTDAVREAIAAAIASFPVVDPPWRWIRSESWHVTLKFLGETDPGGVGRLAEVLSEVATRHAPFGLVLGDIGAFPNLRRPRVIFYRATEGADPLSALAADVDAALAGLPGIERDDRPFRAHVTVARVKQSLPPGIVRKLESAPGLSGAVQEVESFALMRSQLGPKGARYEPVKQFALTFGP